MIAHIAPRSDRPALIAADGSRTLTYAELHDTVHSTMRALDAVWPHARTLAFLTVRNDIDTIVALLALRAAGHAVVLVDGALDAAQQEALRAHWRPSLLVASAPDADVHPLGMRPLAGALGLFVATPATAPVALHPSLALCLTTSGSTGSPKLVRLSAAAVIANAFSIAHALEIGVNDRAITCLPLHYAYGLSLLTSHLVIGASLVVSDRGFMDVAFWHAVKTHQVTSLAGVPYMYEMLERLGVARAVPPCVRVMTQAGGRLADASVQRLHAFMDARGGRFHVMYGQTEATARIAIMPHTWLPKRLGSAGRAVPGGTLEVRDADGALLPAGSEGEVIYRGANVMLGYATEREDLARGDDQHGELRTGDLGRVTEDGCLTITGRLKRIGKLFGVRIDLDAIERDLNADAPAAVLEGDNQLVVFTTASSAAGSAMTASTDTDAPSPLVLRLSTQLRVQQRAIVVRSIDSIPRTASGKVDYPALRRAL